MRMLLLILLFLLLSGFKPTKVLLPSSLVIIDESERVLVAQVGVLEEAENRGKKIYEYQKCVGIPAGAPYCAAGQYYCFWKATQNLKLPENLIPIKKTGLAFAVYEDAVARGQRVVYTAAKHDLLVWKKKIGINGHIERIVEVKQKGWVKTIGFNITSGGKSGVFYKIRNIYHPLQRMVVVGLVGFQYD